MPAHLVTPRWKIADSQDLQALEEDPRLDAKRLADGFKTEDIAASSANSTAGFEPVPDLDEIATSLAILGIHVSQVASNRVFQNGQQKFQLALDDVISPDQVGILSRQQKPGVECFFVR